MTVKKFTFGSVIEEVEIGNKQYVVDFSDTAVEKRDEVLHKWHKEYAAFANTDIDSLDINDQRLKLSSLRENMKEFIESVLGEGVFAELYELSGKSTTNLLELALFLMEFIAEKSNKSADTLRSKYTKKK